MRAVLAEVSRVGPSAPTVGSPAPAANAFFVRGIYFIQATPELELGLSASLGAGEGIRLVVAGDENAAPARFSTDTIAAGPILLGPGISADYWINKTFAVRGTLQTYLAFPTFAFAPDLTVGVNFAF